MIQAQTNMKTLVKHRRSLEDGLITRNLDISKQVTLNWVKDTSPGQDRRCSTQNAIAVTSSHVKFGASVWKDSQLVTSGLAHNLPLIRVNEMIGYDADAKPGAAMRAEQPVACNLARCVGSYATVFLIP